MHLVHKAIAYSTVCMKKHNIYGIAQYILNPFPISHAPLKAVTIVLSTGKISNEKLQTVGRKSGSKEFDWSF